MPETINHPLHYNMGSIEVIDAIEDWKLGFNLGNAVKYIARAEHKGRLLEDLKKAAWYLAREIAKHEPMGCVCVTQDEEEPWMSLPITPMDSVIESLSSIEVTEANLEEVRRSLYHPTESEWNEWVRELTAARLDEQLWSGVTSRAAHRHSSF